MDGFSHDTPVLECSSVSWLLAGKFLRLKISPSAASDGLGGGEGRKGRERERKKEEREEKIQS